MPSSPPLILASRSPARLRLLKAAGIDARVEVSDAYEGGFDPKRPVLMVAGLARRKAEVVAARCPETLILGCDSTLELDGVSHNKPADSADALRRWHEMRGRSAVLHTGHCLIAADGSTAHAVASTVVHFAAVTDSEIGDYVASGEPLEVAGAFTLDGLSAPFIDGVEGDPSNVIGLSLPLLRTLLNRLGIPITSLWRPVGTAAAGEFR